MATLRRLCLLAALFAALPMSAGATPVSWLLQGSVTSSSVPNAAVGDMASMLLTFDLAAPDLDPSSGCGLYQAIVDTTATVAGTTYSSTGGFVEVSTASSTGCGATPPGFPAYTFRTWQSGGPGGGPGDLNAFFELGPVPSDLLPAYPLDPSQFANAGMLLKTADRNSVIAHFTSVNAVPEPSAILLVATGLGGVLLTRRRRRLP